MSINRRQFNSLTGTACSLALMPKKSLGKPRNAQHFFLYIWYGPGADASYLWDARPLTMTTAGKIQNYLGQDPNVWTGVNGQSTLITGLAEPLKPFLRRFSILNGVHMATGDEGHSQNISYLLTGNSLLSGPSLLAELGKTSLPLDYLQIGNYFDFNPINYTNAPAGLATTVADAVALSQSLQTIQNKEDSDAGEHLISRAHWVGRGHGLFSSGSRDLAQGMMGQSDLRHKLAQIKIENSSSMGESAARLVHQYFVHGITDGAMIVLGNETLDAHSPGQARQQAGVLTSILKEVALILRYFEETPFDESQGLSLLDATTVVCGPEFSRTMRQIDKPIVNTGTDHNPLTNSLLIGGRGIKGGLVVGASDLAALDTNGQFKDVSQAHRQMDPLLIKSMGRCFDPLSLTPVPSLPERYDPNHYLSINMVVNTLHQLFGTPDSLRRRFSPNGPATLALLGLLA